MKQQLTPDVAGKIAFQPQQVSNAAVGLIQEQNQRDKAAAAAYGASLRQDMQRRVDDTNRQKEAAKMYGEDVKKLTKFSQTLLDYFVKEQHKKNQAEMEQGIADAYTNGISLEEAEGLEQAEAELAENDSLTQEAGVQALEQTNDYEVASRVKGLSGWRGYGYKIGRAQMAGAAYSAFIGDAMESDNTTQITINGETFTPATARGSAQIQAAMATLRGNFIRNFGLTGVPAAILNKYAFPAMHRTDSQLVGKFKDRFAAEESFNEQTEAKATFQADKNLGAFIQRLSATLGRDGKPLGNKGAHQMAKQYLEESVRAGTIDLDEARSLKGQPVPWDNKGRTFGQLYPNLVEGAITNALKVDRAEASYQRQEDERRRKEQEKELIQEIMKNPDAYTQADIEALQKEFFAEHSRRSPGLDEIAKSYNATVDDIDNQRRNLQQLRQIGMLRPHHVQNSHPNLYNEFMGTATQQEAVAAQSGAGGNYTDQMRAIANTVKKARNETTGDGTATIPTQMIISELQGMFKREVAAGIAAGNPNAVTDALNKVNQYFIQEGGTTEGNRVNPNGRYSYSPEQYDRYMERVGKSSSATAYTDKVNKIETMITNVGAKAWDSPGLVLSAPELAELEEGYGEPGWEIPPMVRYLSQKYNKDPFEIINKQREAVGLKPLESLSAEVKQGMSPEGQRLLDRFKSQNRSTRAYSTENVGWNPAMVKHGDVIDATAAAYGQNPAHIAALMEIESGGVADQVSYNGSSFGLMQISRAAHPAFFAGGDWKDPTYNIDYGTKYFAQLMEKYGDPKAAAMAYNAGPGNYDKWAAGQSIPASVEREMVNHGKKFVKALSRYDKGQLNEPLARRGQFEVVQVVSTDPRYEGDKDPRTIRDVPGHGGDAMHQHYEFATKEQARLAKALYESKGFRVTSYMRPHDHGSAHQHGYAIDVAPPLDLPRNDEAEMAWIDEANAVIGL